SAGAVGFAFASMAFGTKNDLLRAFNRIGYRGVYMVRILISYASYSGNTEEAAEMIGARLLQAGCKADMFRIPARLGRISPTPQDETAVQQVDRRKLVCPPLQPA